MKKNKTTIWLAALTAASLAGIPLVMAADPDGDNLKTTPQNAVQAPATQTETKATVEKFNDKLALTTDRNQTIAKPSTTEAYDLVSVANSNNDLQKFTMAVQASGLTQTLQGEGPYTIFAPSDKAFAKLGKEAWENLMKPENQQKLSQILTYHVVPGLVESKDLRAGDYATVEGNPLTAVVSEKDMMVNEAKVVQKDIVAKNGIIHIIDTVLMPPKPAPLMSEPMSSINE